MGKPVAAAIALKCLSTRSSDGVASACGVIITAEAPNDSAMQARSQALLVPLALAPAMTGAHDCFALGVVEPVRFSQHTKDGDAVDADSLHHPDKAGH